MIFKQFGVTAAVAVLASLMVARFLTPMMAAYMMKATPKVEVDGVIMKTYLSIVRACLRHRFLTSLGIIVFLVVSLSAVSLLKTGFFPASDNAQTQVTLTMPPGSELSDTEAMSLKAVKLISGLENIKRVFTVVGSSTSGGGADSSTTSDVTTATLVVDLTPIDDRKLKQSQIEQQMRNVLQELAGVRVEVGNGGNGTELQLTLASDDPILLDQTAAVVGEQLHGLKGIGGITSSAARQAPEIQISPNFARAAALGITSIRLRMLCAWQPTATIPHHGPSSIFRSGRSISVSGLIRNIFAILMPSRNCNSPGQTAKYHSARLPESESGAALGD